MFKGFLLCASIALICSVLFLYPIFTSTLVCEECEECEECKINQNNSIELDCIDGELMQCRGEICISLDPTIFCGDE